MLERALESRDKWRVDLRHAIRWSCAATLTAAVSVGLAIGSARAQTDRAPVTLEWNAESCSSSVEVLSEVARLLGGSATGAKAVEARARIERAPANTERATRFRVSITTRIEGREGQRTMDVASCAEAVQATALIVALAVDPARVAAAQTQAASTDAGRVSPSPLAPIVDAGPDARLPGAPAIDAAPPPVPTESANDAGSPTESAASDAAAAAAPETTPAEPDIATSNPERPWIFAVTALGDVGTLPKLAPGFALHAGFQSHALRVELGFHWLAAETSSNDTDDPLELVRAGEFRALGGDLRGCYLLIDSSIGLGPCVLASLDRIGATAPRVATPLDESAALFAAGGGLVFTAPLVPALRFRTTLDALLPTRRPSFAVVSPTSTTVVHRVGAGLVRGTAGLELRF